MRRPRWTSGTCWIRAARPARLIGRRVRVELSASGGRVLVLDHYLEVLLRKPGALPGSTALSQARAAGTFTAAHDAFWAAARARHGAAEGTRALVEVLLLHRHQVHADVVAVCGAWAGGGWAAALTAGEDRFVRRWFAAVAAASRDDPFVGRVEVSVGVVGAVLAGLGRFGQRCGVQVAGCRWRWGARSLGLAAGVSHDTAAAVLRYLREQPDPFVVLVAPAAGLRGDCYELRIPDRWLRAAYRGVWVAGAVPVPHPVPSGPGSARRRVGAGRGGGVPGVGRGGPAAAAGRGGGAGGWGAGRRRRRGPGRVTLCWRWVDRRDLSSRRPGRVPPHRCRLAGGR